jgi:hypothetical protein
VAHALPASSRTPWRSPIDRNSRANCPVLTHWGLLVKLAASQELYAYWTTLRGARRAPERNEIDPGAIRGVLADTFILEADPALGYPMRIAGSRTSSFFLRELRGSPFLDLWRGPDCLEILDILASVADDAAPMLAGVSARPHGMAAVEFELLLLPLRHHGDTHARILGCCTPKASPQWLGLLPVVSMGLLSLRVLDAATIAGSAAQAPEGPQSAGFGRAREGDRRRHLFVISSADQPR